MDDVNSFVARIGAALARAAADSDGRAAALLCIDLDWFRLVDQAYGRDVGDELLRQVGERIARGIRSTDAVCLGPSSGELRGDDFLVLLDGLRDHLAAARVADRLVLALSRPYSVAGRSIDCTACIGLTTTALGYRSPTAMIRDARTAMSHAHAEGRAKYAAFNPAAHRAASERRACGMAA